MLRPEYRAELVGRLVEPIITIDDQIVIFGQLGHLALGVQHAQGALLRAIVAAMVHAARQHIDRLVLEERVRPDPLFF